MFLRVCTIPCYSEYFDSRVRNGRKCLSKFWDFYEMAYILITEIESHNIPKGMGLYTLLRTFCAIALFLTPCGSRIRRIKSFFTFILRTSLYLPTGMYLIFQGHCATTRSGVLCLAGAGGGGAAGLPTACRRCQ